MCNCSVPYIFWICPLKEIKCITALKSILCSVADHSWYFLHSNPAFIVAFSNKTQTKNVWKIKQVYKSEWILVNSGELYSYFLDILREDAEDSFSASPVSSVIYCCEERNSCFVSIFSTNVIIFDVLHPESLGDKASRSFFLFQVLFLHN